MTTAHLYNLAHFLELGLVKPPLFVQNVFGILGGIGPHPEDVMHMKRTADRLFGKQYKWSVLGAGRNQLPIAAQAAAMGDPGKARIRMNDGKVDRRGRFVAGYMDYEERDPICGLFRLDPAGAVAKLDDGIVCSNGPSWSSDGRTFYFADTYTREIWAYDYDEETGSASRRRVFCFFPGLGLKGLPDGATVDAEGFVWSVSVYEGKLVRIAPDGKLDRVVGLPVESTTSLSFGGPGLDVAYVTSMARAVKGVRPKEREAGALFAVHGLGVRGLPEPRFAG